MYSEISAPLCRNITLVVHLQASSTEDRITYHSVFTEIRLDIYKSPSRVNHITSTVWPETHEGKAAEIQHVNGAQ